LGLNIHAAAAKGFASSSDAYERGRPSYPREAVDRLIHELGIAAGSTVVELGAGTGKFTRLLPAGARVIAVEPVAAMRQKLVDAAPNADVREGDAEAIPLPDAAGDAVVAAQAFHWFRGPEALREIHRVLRPGGRLGLVWNVRDESVEWVARLSEILNWHESGVPRYWKGEWRAAFDEVPLFGQLNEAHFRHEQEVDVGTLVDRVCSISFVAAMSQQDRDAIIQQVEDLVVGFPERFALPYRTDVFWCSRL
jgi:SAM-dependent methyltransferase